MKMEGEGEWQKTMFVFEKSAFVMEVYPVCFLAEKEMPKMLKKLFPDKSNYLRKQIIKRAMQLSADADWWPIVYKRCNLKKILRELFAIFQIHLFVNYQKYEEEIIIEHAQEKLEKMFDLVSENKMTEQEYIDACNELSVWKQYKQSLVHLKINEAFFQLNPKTNEYEWCIVGFSR